MKLPNSKGILIETVTEKKIRRNLKKKNAWEVLNEISIEVAEDIFKEITEGMPKRFIGIDSNAVVEGNSLEIVVKTTIEFHKGILGIPFARNFQRTCR